MYSQTHLIRPKKYADFVVMNSEGWLINTAIFFFGGVTTRSILLVVNGLCPGDKDGLSGSD